MSDTLDWNDLLAAMESFDAMIDSRGSEFTCCLYGIIIKPGNNLNSVAIRDKIYSKFGESNLNSMLTVVDNGLFLSTHDSYYKLSSTPIPIKYINAGFYDRKNIHSHNSIKGVNAIESLHATPRELSSIKACAKYVAELGLEVLPINWYAVELRKTTDTPRNIAPTVNVPVVIAPTVNVPVVNATTNEIDNDGIFVESNHDTPTQSSSVPPVATESIARRVIVTIEKILPIKYDTGKTPRPLLKYLSTINSSASERK